jgi:hypothetical protein
VSTSAITAIRSSVGVTPISVAVGFSSAAPAPPPPSVTSATDATQNADTNATTSRRRLTGLLPPGHDPEIV